MQWRQIGILSVIKSTCSFKGKHILWPYNRPHWQNWIGLKRFRLYPSPASVCDLLNIHMMGLCILCQYSRPR